MGNLDLATITSIAAGILYLLATGVILRGHSSREKQIRLLLVFVAASCVWELGRSLLGMNWLPFATDGALTRMTLYGMLVLSLLFFHLSRSFLHREGAGWGWWALGVVWIVALIILDNNLPNLPDVIWLGGRLLIERTRMVIGGLFLGWGVFIGSATASTLITHRRTRQPLHRNRITYWSLALILIAGGSALLLTRYKLLSSAFYLLSTLSAGYVAMTHRLLDVRQVTRQVLSYLIVTLLTTMAYIGGFLAAQYLFQTIPGYTPLLAGIAIALILAVCLPPLLRLIQRVVNRLLSGAGYDPGHALREYSTSISNIPNLERLTMVVVGLISEVIGVQHGALFVVHHERGKSAEEGGFFHLHGAKGTGDEEEDRRFSSILPAESPVTQYLRLAHAPLTQYDVDLQPRFQEISETVRKWLTDLNMDIYLPIYAKEEWIGLLALGPKRSGDRYFDDEIVLLSTLADQTAIALENTRLFEDLRAQNVEIERLNTDLTTANRELARVGKAKSDFIDIASHELRTPLTQVRGYTDILDDIVQSESLTPATGVQVVHGLKVASKRLEEIVDTMFDVAKLDAETMTLHPIRTSVDSIVRTAVDEWRGALDERKQTLTVQNLADLPPIVGDFTRLRQVFSNLIQNGIKYTPDGGQIRITGRMLEWTLPRDQTIEIVVADTGIGIAPDDLERIFDRFYRVGNVLFHSTGKIKFKGAGPGLGLTLARGIVEAHGGRIWAESLGCDEQTCPGSQFHVLLPVHPPHLEPEESLNIP